MKLNTKLCSIQDKFIWHNCIPTQKELHTSYITDILYTFLLVIIIEQVGHTTIFKDCAEHFSKKYEVIQ